LPALGIAVTSMGAAGGSKTPADSLGAEMVAEVDPNKEDGRATDSKDTVGVEGAAMEEASSKEVRSMTPDVEVMPG